MRWFCLTHRTLTLWRACPDCLRAHGARSLAERRAEVAALRERADQLQRTRRAGTDAG